MEHTPTYYRRNLPHYLPPYATFFVTTRLVGSLPKEALEKLNKERDRLLKQTRLSNDRAEQERYSIHKKYFAKFDELLDRGSTGPHWLADSRIASLVSEALQYRDNKVYMLYCAIIMPNHIHMVFKIERDDIPLFKILQSLKRHTAREANKILKRSGRFWQHESYDHVVRDGAELERIIVYIFLNPQKAQLVKRAAEWKWTYIREDFRYLTNNL